EELAGIVSTIVYDSNRERDEADPSLSPGAYERLAQIVKIAKQVDKTQQQYGVPTPINVDSTVAGLIEAWAQGISWDRLMRLTNIGEGDLVRIIRRTADLLRQFSRIDHIPPTLAE